VNFLSLFISNVARGIIEKREREREKDEEKSNKKSDLDGHRLFKDNGCPLNTKLKHTLISRHDAELTFIIY
jgi:hypothetical protein